MNQKVKYEFINAKFIQLVTLYFFNAMEKF